MLPGCLVGDFGKLADQFLEHQPHLRIAYRFRVQVDIGEFIGNLIEQSRLGQAVYLCVEVEALEDVPHRRGECLDVGIEVFADVVLVAHQRFHIQRGGVVEALPGFAQQERLR